MTALTTLFNLASKVPETTFAIDTAFAEAVLLLVFIADSAEPSVYPAPGAAADKALLTTFIADNKSALVAFNALLKAASTETAAADTVEAWASALLAFASATEIALLRTEALLLKAALKTEIAEAACAETADTSALVALAVPPRISIFVFPLAS
jgi:hypothetical protein